MTISRREVLCLLSLTPVALRARLQESTAPARFRRMFEGLAGTYVIEPDGRVKCWTTHANGARLQFGDDHVVPPYIAEEVGVLKGATKIAAAGGAGYAVMRDGRVLSWGENWNGLLGNTPLEDFELKAQAHPPAPVPAPTQPMPKAVDLSAQTRHVLALTSEGTVYVWGNGQVGQLGLGAMPVINFKARLPEPAMYMPFPVRVPDLADVRAIAAGEDYSLALLKDGRLMAWGQNRYGQLGDGTTVGRPSPVAVKGITNAVAIDVSSEYSMALLADGTVMTWGYGHAALGRPGIQDRSVNSTPMPVPGVTGITAIAAGGAHALALRQDGRVISWGDDNVYKPVGHPGDAPAPVSGITNVRSVQAGSLSSAATLADGTIMVWGALPSLFFHLDDRDESGTSFPVPLVVKGL